MDYKYSIPLLQPPIFLYRSLLTIKKVFYHACCNLYWFVLYKFHQCFGSAYSCFTIMTIDGFDQNDYQVSHGVSHSLIYTSLYFCIWLKIGMTEKWLMTVVCFPLLDVYKGVCRPHSQDYMPWCATGSYLYLNVQLSELKWCSFSRCAIEPSLL